ncbi:MAG: hypothetical protein ABFS23_05130 [Pseudomonadota bacterium]
MAGNYRALFLVGAGALLLAAGAAPQADFGYANSHCARWLDPENAAEEPARRQWIFGYLSAAARYGDKDLSTLDPNDAIARLQAYCGENPHESLEAAVLSVILTEE